MGNTGKYKEEPGGEPALQSTLSSLLEGMGVHITHIQDSWVVRETVDHGNMIDELGDSGVGAGLQRLGRALTCSMG